LLRGEPFRAKFRNSWEKPEPLTPGKKTEINFTMPDLFHTFRRGHRIMVQVQSSWFPLTDRNPQTFTDIPNAKPEEFQKATEQVFRQKDAASGVEVLVTGLPGFNHRFCPDGTWRGTMRWLRYHSCLKALR
jgi:predicted acyl esterase